MENKKVVVIPGAFQYAKNYGDYIGIDIWLKEKIDNEIIKKADFILAHSFGANYFFSFPIFNNQKLILVNPSIKKRSFLNLLIRDLKYLFSKIDSIETNKIVPVSNWLHAFWKAYKLSKIDILSALKKIPRENIFIIRGNRDKFFCDKEVADLIKKEKLNLIEADAGHDWNQKIADAVNEIIMQHDK